MSMHFSIIMEFLSLLVALFHYKRLKETFYVYAIPFLFFVLYAEIGAAYYRSNHPVKTNHTGNTHIYLWISIAETIFYSWFFYQVATGYVFKRLVKIFATMLVLTYLFLSFFYFSYVGAYYIIMTVTGIYFTIMSCIYFYKLSINAGEENIINLASFWMATGIFVFYSGISLVMVLHEMLMRQNVTIFGESLYNVIPQVLSIILYGCFIAAFILCRKKKTI